MLGIIINRYFCDFLCNSPSPAFLNPLMLLFFHGTYIFQHTISQFSLFSYLNCKLFNFNTWYIHTIHNIMGKRKAAPDIQSCPGTHTWALTQLGASLVLRARPWLPSIEHKTLYRTQTSNRGRLGYKQTKQDRSIIISE